MFKLIHISSLLQTSPLQATQARPGEEIFLIPEAQPAHSYASTPSGLLLKRLRVRREVASGYGKNTSLDLHPQQAESQSRLNLHLLM